MSSVFKQWLLIGAVVSGVASPIFGVGAPVVAHADSYPNLYDYSDADLASAGYQVRYSDAITTFEDGGKDYIYNNANGHTVEFAVHPAGFDPRRADAAHLARYHFPARPTDPSAASDWDHAMANVPAATPKAMGRLVLAPQIRGATQQPDSLNWAWWDDNLVPHKPTSLFSGTEADYNEPFAALNGCPKPIGQTQWIGIGGATPGGNALDQAGTETVFPLTGLTIYHQPWFEVLPLPAAFGPYQANPGDLELLGVVVVPSSNPNFLTFSWYVQDQNLGWSYSGETSISPSEYDGTTVEWVMERPIVNRQLINLLPFSNVTFSGIVETYLTNGQPTTGSPGQIGVNLQYGDMKGSLKDPILATVDSSLSGGNAFTAYWQNCD